MRRSRVALARAALAVALLVCASAGGCRACRHDDAPSPGEEKRDAGSPTGGEPPSYSAVVVRSFERGSERTETESTYAKKGDWVREEWREGDRRLAAIVRPDLGRTFLVDADRGVFVEAAVALAAPDSGAELSGDAIEQLVAGGSTGATVSRERGGSEVVAGHPCTIFHARMEAADGTASESTVWEADDLGGLALKSEVRGPDGARATTELRDVKVPADDALFAPPDASRRVDALDTP